MANATSTPHAYAKLTFEQVRVLVAACESLIQRNTKGWPRNQDVEIVQRQLIQLLPTDELRRRDV